MDDQALKQLAEVNARVVRAGEVLPAVTLQDGRRVQTGTVAAMLENVRRYNRGERGEVESALRLAVPTLFAVGLFELFPPQDWVQGSDAGRRLVGEQALALLAAGAPGTAPSGQA